MRLFSQLEEPASTRHVNTECGARDTFPTKHPSLIFVCLPDDSKHTMPLAVLYESSVGYALFDIVGAEEIGAMLPTVQVCVPVATARKEAEGGGGEEASRCSCNCCIPPLNTHLSFGAGFFSLPLPFFLLLFRNLLQTWHASANLSSSRRSSPFAQLRWVNVCWA